MKKQSLSNTNTTSLNAGMLQRKCECGNHTVAGDKCDGCKNKEGVLQRKSSNNSEHSEVPPIVHEVLNSSGQPLDKSTRAFFESRFEHNFSQVPVSSISQQLSRSSLTVGEPTDVHEQEADRIADSIMLKEKPENKILSVNEQQGEKFDLSQVRIYTDARAAESARAVNALAYTVKNNIVFGAGQFAPETNEGQRLLGHELTHVVQQRRNGGRLQRQPATGSKPASQPNPAPGLGPARTKVLEDLIKANDFQGAVDTLVHYKYMDYEIDLNLLVNKKMFYDSDLKSADGSTLMASWDYLSTPQKAQPARVRIGPSAFSSIPYLYSVIMHEYQHVLWQQTLANQNLSHLTHSQGFSAPDEVKAGAWELLHATETGIDRLPDKVAQIWANLNDAFWKLAAQDQPNERQLVERAFQKAKTFMKGSQLTLVPFRQP